MSIFNKIQIATLRCLSRRPSEGRYNGFSKKNIDHALDQLVAMYPGFLDQIKGKRVVDFGCGQGIQSMALAKAGAAHVVGVDINKEHLEMARQEAKQMGLDNVTYCDGLGVNATGSFDWVISHNSMEHFAEPYEVLCLFKKLIHKEGRIYITFGPPWYSPYGAHMNFFTKVPWVHLFFSEKAVIAVRSNFTDDKATCYENVRGGLNRMTLSSFQRLLDRIDCHIIYRKYVYMLNFSFLETVPLLKELCLYHINVILRKE